jgi:hypothetical protein
VDHPLLVSVLHPLANLAEEVQPLLGVEAVAVAVVRDGDSLHVLHCEERPSLVRRPGFEGPGDVRVAHQGQGLAFRLEPGQHLLRVHSPLDELQSHSTAHRPLLVGLPHLAHPAFADLLKESVVSDQDRWRGAGVPWRTRSIVVSQQVLDRAPQILVSTTGLIQPS